MQKAEKIAEPTSQAKESAQVSINNLKEDLFAILTPLESYVHRSLMKIQNIAVIF